MTASVWIGLGALILINALYVAAEFGAVGVRRNRVKRLAEDGHWTARALLPHVQDTAALDRFVGASQIGITLSSLGLGAFAQATVSTALAPVVGAAYSLAPDTALTVTSVSVLLVLTSAQLIIGELVPKAIALQYPTQTALLTFWPMRASLWLFSPALVLLNGSASLALRLFGISGHGHRHLHSPEEIDLLIAESSDGGLLEPDEQQRLHRALRLRFRTARDLMVPIARLTMLDVDAPWATVLATVSSSPYSRIPVFRGTPASVVGTLRVKDLVGRYIASGPAALGGLVRPVVRVTGDIAADRLIQLLRERRAHQAIVVDDQDRTLGLVTIQDILSEMLGDVRTGARPAGVTS